MAFVGNDQAYMIVDTTKRKDSVIVILRATDATPIFWSQERSDLEGNLDAGGNPVGGMPMFNTDPPLIFEGARLIFWARAAASTKIAVQVIAQRVGVSVAPSQGVNIPGTAPPVDRRPTGGNVRLPGLEDSWTKKGGVQ